MRRDCKKYNLDNLLNVINEGELLCEQDKNCDYAIMYDSSNDTVWCNEFTSDYDVEKYNSATIHNIKTVLQQLMLDFSLDNICHCIKVIKKEDECKLDLVNKIRSTHSYSTNGYTYLELGDNIVRIENSYLDTAGNLIDQTNFNTWEVVKNYGISLQ